MRLIILDFFLLKKNCDINIVDSGLTTRRLTDPLNELLRAFTEE